MSTLPERLRFSRERCGFSARGLSVRAGLASAHVGLIESGVVVNPETKTTLALAKALRVSFAWLAADDGPMLPERPELNANNPAHLGDIESALRSDRPPSDGLTIERSAEFDQRTGTEG